MYRSKLEKKVHLLLGEDWSYETWKFPYTMVKEYTPDFSRGTVHIEVKGFFRQGDQAKYIAINNCLPPGEELVFIFENPNKPVRKGAKLTMGRWAEIKGFRYFGVDEIEGI